MFSAFLPGHMHAYVLLYLHEYNRRFSWEHFILAGSELCGGSACLWVSWLTCLCESGNNNRWTSAARC